jgi:NAD(P)-dependent dehydrogenase (short-subunit alcohol dehydrogenase family)
VGASPSRDVLVTGAAGGLGAATCRALLADGWRVFAADLAAPAVDGVVPLVMDVTDQASVDAAVAEVRRATDRLGGVLHFAGILRAGALVDYTAEQLAQVLDVNLLGAHRVTRATLDLVRAGRGRIVLLSSETGVQTAAPFNGSYAVSKHAVEAYGDSLRRELAFLGIPVIKLQPGPFRTDMVETVVARFEAAAARSELFGDIQRSMLSILPREQAKAREPEVLAEVAVRVLTEKRWRPAYLVHPDRTRMLLERLPVRVADRVVHLGISVMRRRR